MKLPRRLVRQADIEAAAAEYVRWRGVTGARNVVRELRTFWSRRNDAGRATVQRRILAAIDALARSRTVH